MSGNEPLVSICCLSYNHGKYIEQAIRSFWEQDYKNIEILALDDGSPDDSYEVLKRLKEISPCPMEVYSQKNSGNIPKNFNFTLKKAKGKYVTILALDDMLLQDCISSKVEMMEKDDNIQLVLNTKFLNFNSDTGEVWENTMNIDKKENITAQDVLDEDFYHIHSYCLQSTVYRKSLVEAVGYFDEDMIADDLIIRTKTAKYILEHPEYKIGALRNSGVKYRRHSSNISKNISLQLRSVAMFYQKYYPGKRRMRTLRNGFRALLKQHHFKDALRLYKDFSLYRDFTLLIPLWLLGIFLKDIFSPFKTVKKDKTPAKKNLQDIKRFFKNKFDFAVALGTDCACTSYLRRFNLQQYSYPFDWLTNAHFENRIDLIANDFKDFLDYDSMVLMPQPAELEENPEKDYYENTKTGLYFWHDFPAGVPLGESYKKVDEKYQRRIKRFYNKIENSKKVLFVWLSHYTILGDDVIQEAYKKLSVKFQGKEIYLLFIENSYKTEITSFEDNHVLVVRQDTFSDDKKHPFNQTMGNQTNNLRIFKKIKLKTNIKEKFKNLLYAITVFGTKLIPNRELRQKAISKVNIMFYHAIL